MLKVLTATALLILWGNTSQLFAAEQRQPNVIIILADDMGYGDAGCYGSPTLKTPHLDRLAAEGMRFTDFHSSGPVCSPTRAGFMTGRYQQRAGIPGVVFADPQRNRHHGLQTTEIVLPKLLREAGYATALFGKWHLGYRKQFNPVHHGFDRFRGFVSGNVDYISHIDGTGVADWWHDDQLTPEEGYTTRLINRYAVEFIEQHRDRPFFLYLAHEAVHSPYQAPDDVPVRAVGRKRIPGTARRDIARAYQQMMTEMDNGIGEVLNTLKQLELDRETLVFFFSDNGATKNGSNGGLRGFKGSLWEGGHRVPAVARWTGHIPPGTVSDTTCISLDLMPTILAVADVDVPEGHHLDGADLTSVFAGEEKRLARPLFWSYRNSSAMRDGDWKLIIDRNNADPQLFDLADDPQEETDLATQQPARVQAMLKSLAAWKADVLNGAAKQPEK